MKKAIIPETGLSVTRFIFGTSSLFNAGSRTKRIRILNSAISSGFSHFDTAPYYGFGMAECDLAHVLKTNPEITVTSKFGIYPAGGDNQQSLEIFLRKAGGKILSAISKPIVDFSIGRAKISLEGSLKRLGRDSIDLYMLHEARLEMLNTDEMLLWLEQCVQSGKIRYFGLALTADKLSPFLKANSRLACVVQISDSLDGREADLLEQWQRPKQITYGYVSAALRQYSKFSVPEILTKALERNPNGAIIVSTRRPERMAQYREIADKTA